MLCFWPIGVSVKGFRPFHLKHHAFLLTSQDPEVHQRALFQDRWTGLTREKKVALLAGDLVCINIAEPLAVARATSGPWTLARSAYCVALACVAVYGLGWVALVWPVALFTVAWACMRARMWNEHLGPEKTQRYVASWWERLYLSYYIWKHDDHHSPGRWNVPCWRLR
jgi:fatty acid desaturase